MQDKKIIVACIVVVICFIVIGIIGKKIAANMPEETIVTEITTNIAESAA